MQWSRTDLEPQKLNSGRLFFTLPPPLSTISIVMVIGYSAHYNIMLGSFNDCHRFHFKVWLGMLSCAIA